MCYLKESCMVDCSDELQVSKERDYLRSVVEQIHNDTHDALSETGVRSLSSLEERAQEWREDYSKRHDATPGDGSWYKRFSPEPITIIEAWGLDHHRASALQYIIRSDAKGGAEDIDKAIWYLTRYKNLKYGA